MISQIYSARETFEPQGAAMEMRGAAPTQGNPLRGILIAGALGSGLWAIILSMIF